MNTTSEVLIREICLKDNTERQIVTSSGKLLSKRTNSISLSPKRFLQYFRSIIYEVFLPRGFPDSVSGDYVAYQIWDTLQACCSTFSGMLAVQSVLQGVGVGRESATPLAAALTWFTKDGVGMISGIVFAWSKGCFLDSECKKWRLFADFINDLALCLELSISSQVERALPLLCVSSALKALVGVAGGATRAALTHHQATRSNTADVAAKDGSQETLVNLITMSVGVWLLHTSFIQSYAWFFMALLVGLHLFCNFKAVKSLQLRKFNEERYLIAIHEYFERGRVPSIETVNIKESVIIGCGLSSTDICGFSVEMGESLKPDTIDSSHLANILSSSNGSKYLLVPDMERQAIMVLLKANVTDQDMLKAYFHTILLAFLVNKTKSIKSAEILKLLYGPSLRPGDDSATKKGQMYQEEGEKLFRHFESLCLARGWNMSEHVLHVEQWRAEWEESKKGK